MEIAVRDTDQAVLQYGTSIACPDGCTIVELDDTQTATFQGLLGQPSGGLTFADGAFTAAPAPTPPPPADPLKPYRDALATAADADPSLSADTKTALTNLLAAMAPR